MKNKKNESGSLDQPREFLAKLIRYTPYLSAAQMKFFIDGKGTDILKNVLPQLGVEFWKPLWNEYYSKRWNLTIDWREKHIVLPSGHCTEMIVIHKELTMEKMVNKIRESTNLNFNLSSNDEKNQELTVKLLENYHNKRFESTYSIWHKENSQSFSPFYCEKDEDKKTVDCIVTKFPFTLNCFELLLLNDFVVQMDLLDEGTSIFRPKLVSFAFSFEKSFLQIHCESWHNKPDITIGTFDLQQVLETAHAKSPLIHLKQVYVM